MSGRWSRSAGVKPLRNMNFMLKTMGSVLLQDITRKSLLFLKGFIHQNNTAAQGWVWPLSKPPWRTRAAVYGWNQALVKAPDFSLPSLRTSLLPSLYIKIKDSY